MNLGKIAYEKQVRLVTNIPYDIFLSDSFAHIHMKTLNSKEEVLQKIIELGDVD